jgi:hypothetical protein
MKYVAKSFTVPAVERSPADCKHGWVAKNRCVLCGQSTGNACDEKDHRFVGESLTCACGTTTRTRRVAHHAFALDGMAKR